MKNKNAFTLIELLVVVLIIGILAAVALPQYQKAVWKSRYATIKSLTRAIANAEEIFYLANGEYTTNFADLDIAMPGGQADSSTDNTYIYNWGYCYINPNKEQLECDLYNNSTAILGYKIMLNNVPNSAGEIQCWARNIITATDMQVRICQSETGVTEPTWGNKSSGSGGWVYP